ncbi:uncharacterized protein LOC128236506 isoform X2 [Mya arenaria]|uniref:uncharacterized protein LOC128236506 isoform X2 n=1 Tax=Mya arenaria TaxID=6604 RepID=UPI0022E892E2|nr:uncharacterized protein LOC128236506 isoform X2 [Mya arenaria]
MMTEQDIGRIWTVVMILVSLTRICDGLGETCTDICAIGEVCTRSGISECNSTTHYTVTGQYQTQCLPKVELGGNCTSGDACATEYAICIGFGKIEGRKCMCGQDYFETTTAQRRVCRLKIPLFSYCDNVYSGRDQCKDPNANCESTADCRCNSGFHDETVNGVVKCAANKALGVSCRAASECSNTNVRCFDDKCRCTYGFYDSNGFSTHGGNCFPDAQLRVLNVQFTVNTTSMNISWSPPAEGKHQNILEYVINYFKLYSYSGFGRSTTSLQTTLYKLIPGGVYRVSVGSLYDRPTPSQTVSEEVTVEQSTEPNPPTALNLTEENLDARDKTIILVWTAPAIGVVKDYEIQLLENFDR